MTVRSTTERTFEINPVPYWNSSIVNSAAIFEGLSVLIIVNLLRCHTIQKIRLNSKSSLIAEYLVIEASISFEIERFWHWINVVTEAFLSFLLNFGKITLFIVSSFYYGSPRACPMPSTNLSKVLHYRTFEASRTLNL